MHRFTAKNKCIWQYSALHSNDELIRSQFKNKFTASVILYALRTCKFTNHQNDCRNFTLVYLMLLLLQKKMQSKHNVIRVQCMISSVPRNDPQYSEIVSSRVYSSSSDSECVKCECVYTLLTRITLPWHLSNLYVYIHFFLFSREHTRTFQVRAI